MKRTHLFWIVFLAIGMNACAILRPPSLDPTNLDITKACAEWRWIGISRTGVRCPEVAGWTVKPLFPQLAPVQSCDTQGSKKVPTPDLIRELNRFCVYEPTHPKKLAHLKFPPAASAELVRLDRDCAALSLGEKYLNVKDWAPDADFRAQAGKPEVPLRIVNQRGVRLAFLDTEPTSEDYRERRGSSPHGYTLVRIARDLVCSPEPNGPCAAQITTRLALPVIDFDPKSPKHNWTDSERGGFLGMQSDLAQAIRDEVDAWQARKAQQHLVLNLSLAWDGELFGGLSGEQIDEMRAGTQAVYRALQYATAFDALVLAATGNQKREPCTNVGPLLPAAWEREAPRDATCHNREAKPLLYAVGGLHFNDKPLTNARHNGMPKRAAYGETAIFTGSSVATAIASSIAAVVWDSFPYLSSHEVMEILDTRRENELDFKADFWFGSTAPLTSGAPWVRRLSLCTALEEACERHGPPCPLAARCESTKRVARLGLGTTAARGSCQPWLYPQPEDEPCPACIKPPPPPR